MTRALLVAALLLSSCSVEGDVSRRDVSNGRRSARISDAGFPDPVDVAEIWIAGQSNAGLGGAVVNRTTPRYDLRAARAGNPAAGNPAQRYFVPWGPLSYSYVYAPAGQYLKGYDVALPIILKDTYGKSAHIIHCAQSGIGFGTTANPGGWMPPSNHGGVGGAVFNAWIALLQQTRSSHYRPGQKIFFSWTHGETDAITDAAAAQYLSNLNALLSDTCAAVGVDLADVYVLITQMSATGNGIITSARNTVRQAEIDFVNAAPSTRALVPTDDASKYADNTHFDAPGCELIASREAGIIAGLLP